MVKEEKSVDLVVSGDDMLSLVMAHVAIRKGQTVAILGEPPLPSQSDTAGNLFFFGLLHGREGRFEIALRNRSLLHNMAMEIGYSNVQSGLLLPAYHEKELTLIEELALLIGSFDQKLTVLTPEETVGLSPFLNPVRLEGSLYVPEEIGLDIGKFRQLAFGFLARHPNVLVLPGDKTLVWKEPILEGIGFRIYTRKIFFRQAPDRIPTAFGGAPSMVHRRVQLPVPEMVKGPFVQLAWVQSPPSAFSVLPAYVEMQTRGYYHQPPGLLYLNPGSEGELLLHQFTLQGDPGEARLFAALRKSLRTFPEERVPWDLFWKSEESSSHQEPMPNGESKNIMDVMSDPTKVSSRFLFPFAEDFLSKKGSGLFQA